MSIFGALAGMGAAETGTAVRKAVRVDSSLRISDVWDEVKWYIGEFLYEKDTSDGKQKAEEYDGKIRTAVCNTVIDKNPVIEKEVVESVLDTVGDIERYCHFAGETVTLLGDRKAWIAFWVESYNQSIISTVMGVMDELILTSLCESSNGIIKRTRQNFIDRLVEDMVENAMCADRCLVIKAREPMKDIVSRVVIKKYGGNESAVRSILNRIDEKDENNLYENIFLAYAYLARGDESLMQKLRAGYGASVLDAVFSVLEEYASKLPDKTEEKEAAFDGSALAAADESAASGSLSRLEEELQWLSDSFIRVGKEAGTEVVLCNPDFVAKKLSYDGIIIGTQGIFVVKMCDYTGQLIIDTQGNWVCRKADGTEEAQKSPVSGLMKNEKLLRSIVGEDVPIISVICMTDEKTVVKNQENSKVPIQRMESLVEFMETFSNGWQLSKESRKEYQDKIEAYIV